MKGGAVPRKEPELRHEDEFLDLIGKIYDAALDSSQWTGALKDVRESIGGTNMVLQVGTKYPQTCTFLFSDGVPEEGAREYIEHYASIDPRVGKLDQDAKGTVSYDYLHTEEGDMDRSEYYDWLGRYDLKYYVGSKILDETDITAILSVQRSPLEGHVQDRDIDAFARLIPHFARGVQISQRFEDLDLRHAAMFSTLDRMPFGVIFCDATGKIVGLNRYAGEIIELSDGLSITPSGLSAATGQLTGDLRSLIARSAQTVAGAGLSPGGTLSLARPSMKRPLSVLVSPLRLREVEWSSRPPAVAVFVSDPERAPMAPMETISRLYGLLFGVEY